MPGLVPGIHVFLAANRKRPMDCHVYVLGTITPQRRLTYVGWTNDIARRLALHNAGKGARSTRGRTWVLLHSESFASKTEAMSREWHLKRDRALRKKLASALGAPTAR
jgi:putative endonuclease